MRAWRLANQPGVAIYREAAAYRFLLEVVCGLHSPLLGETEVMGQFREFYMRTEFPATPWGHFLRNFLTDILTDAKRIRNRHLGHLGSQSYGSLARRWLKDQPALALIGTGRLAADILPWLVNEARVSLFYRNRAAAETLQQAYQPLNLVSLQDGHWAEPEAGLIVAAPLTSSAVSDWAAQHNTKFVKTLDLRGESATDPLALNGEVINLATFFAALKTARAQVETRVVAARREIERLTQRQGQVIQCRPFGWEDLCA